MKRFTRTDSSLSKARRSLASALLFGALVSLTVLPRAGAQTGAESATPLTIAAVKIEPKTSAAETLCGLKIEIENRDSRIASQLEFRVEIDGNALPVYNNHVFMLPVEPETATELQLFNFWTAESSRPLPEDGELEISVTLVAAQWMSIEDEEGVEVWQPLEAVDGLPVVGTARLKLPD